MTNASSVPDVGTVIGWIAFVAAGVILGIVFWESIWTLLIGLAVLISIPVWAVWSTISDQRRQSRRN